MAGMPTGIMTINITTDSYKHLQAVLDGMMMGNGAITGRPASIEINKRVQPLVDALYEVLSGGSVSSPVAGTLTVTPGVPASVTDLKAMEKSCLDSINLVNGTFNIEIVLPV